MSQLSLCSDPPLTVSSSLLRIVLVALRDLLLVAVTLDVLPRAFSVRLMSDRDAVPA